PRKTHIKAVARVSSYAALQLRLAHELALSSNEVDVWIFFIGGDTLVLPLLTAKLLQKRVVLIRAGSLVETLESAHDKMAYILEILSRFGQRLSDRIVVYSQSVEQSIIGRTGSDRITVARHH